MAGDDIIDDCLRELRPHVTLDEWHRISYRLRQRWGGCMVYARRDGIAGKEYLIQSGLGSGLSKQEAFDRAGVSRSTGYRLLQRRR